MEIKPCPFCGSTDIEYSTKHKSGGGSFDGHMYDNWHAAMYCKKCHAYGPRNLIKIEVEDLFTYPREEVNKQEYVDKAIRLWNERT